MKRDSLFFRLFQELPGGFFQLIGRPDTNPDDYDLKAIEYKETAVRLDGVFQPREPRRLPAYIWEAQNYASNKVYANLLSKVGRFLEHGDPAQDWVAVVIYPSRTLEQKNLEPYRCLIASDQLLRIYLDELPSSSPDHFEMGILQLIASPPEAALEQARRMVPRLRASNRSAEFRRRMVQFVETVILYQFPKLSREEIEVMLQVQDVRETRVFQEALEEGIEKGLVKGREEAREEAREEVTLAVAKRLLALGRPVEEIAEATDLPVAKIRTLKKKSKK